VFELIYFRPARLVHALVRNLYEARPANGRRPRARGTRGRRPGDARARYPAQPAAAGYAEEIGIPYHEGMTRNRYAGRTFIQPSDWAAPARQWTVKLSALRDRCAAGAWSWFE